MAAEQRWLNDAEKRLVFDLDNLGMDRENMSKFFGVEMRTLLRHIQDQRKANGNESYTLEEMSNVMTRFILTSLARNMHKLTEEQKLRVLPDLLRIKDGTSENDDLGVHLFAPKKTKTKKENIIIED